MPFIVLDPIKNRDEWHHHLGTLPALLNDVYYYPEYLHLSRIEDTATPRIFVYTKGEACWLYPFLLRRVPPLEGISPAHGGYFDIETQYGYGGPVSNSEDPAFIEEANEAFCGWCAQEGVIAEFVRFHPLIDNQRFLPSAETFLDRETVSLDLLAVSEAANPFDAKTNSMLRRAQRSGLECRVCTGKADFEEFVRLYKATMARLKANDFYYFSDHYFMDLLPFMQNHGYLVVARAAGAIVAAAVFIKGTRFLHYHLSATDIDNRIPGVMNAVLHTAALHGKSAPLLMLHLGGGRTRSSDDSLLKFKKTMATGSHQFKIGKRIHNKQVHGELCAAWEKQFPHLVDTFGMQLLCYHNVS